MTSSPDATSPDPTSPDATIENPSPGLPIQADDAAQTQDPAWLTALQQSLVEALPRLYGVPADPVVSEAIAALTLALAAGELDCPLPPAALSPGPGQRQPPCFGRSAAGLAPLATALAAGARCPD